MKALSRRNFLLSAGSITLGSTLAMSGCGGFPTGAPTGGANGNLTKKTFNGTLTLPTGTDLTKLKIVGPIEISKLTGNQFNVTGFEQFPSLVSIIDPARGKTILLGMIDPASSLHFLDAANCAATLLFLALGGSQHFGADRQTFWTSVLASSGLANLVAVITTQMSTDLYALENGNSQIIAALGAAAHGTMIAQPFSLRRATRSSIPPIGRSAANGATITVSSTQNGLELFNQNNTGVTAKNNTLRDGVLHVYLARQVGADQTQHVPNPPQTVGPAHTIRPSAETASIPFDIIGQDVTDNFDLIYLTPVFDLPDGSAFTNGKYQSEKTGWRTELGQMYKRAEVGLVSKILLEAVGMSGVTFTPESLDPVIQTVDGMGGESANLIAAAGTGIGLNVGVKGFVQLARASDPAATNYLAAIAPIIQASNPVLFYDLSHRNLTSEQLGAFIGALRLIALTGAMALSLELGAEYKDLTTGENGSNLTVSVDLGFVRISPNGGSYTPGNNVTLTVSVSPSYGTGPFSYHWKLATVSSATLDDGAGHNSTDFVTDHASVVMHTQFSSVGDANIACTVSWGTGANQQSYDVATTLTHIGSQGLHVETFTGPTSSTILGMAVLQKPKTAQGGNHYQGGRLRADIVYVDLVNPGNNGTQHMEFPVPAFTGLPAPNGNPMVVGTRIHADVGGTSSTYASIDLWDLGDRLVMISIKAFYYPTNTQAEIDGLYLAVNQGIANTTLTAQFP